MMSLSLLQSMVVTSHSQADGDCEDQKKANVDQLETRTVPQLLVDLVDIVTKIAKADQMILEVEAQTPQDPAAEKWREISKQAFAFSREAMKTQQQKLLDELKSSATGRVLRTAVDVKSISMETKNEEPTTPSTAASESPCSAPATPPGLECRTSSGKEQGLCKVVQDLRDQYGVRSMRKEIETLKQYPDRRVIIVRKIKALGFESSEILKKYFGQFGGVSEVIVPHSFTKPGPQRKLGRIRPGVMGFVVMETADGAEAAIANGESQILQSPKGESVAVQVVWFQDSYSSMETEE